MAMACRSWVHAAAQVRSVWQRSFCLLFFCFVSVQKCGTVAHFRQAVDRLTMYCHLCSPNQKKVVAVQVPDEEKRQRAALVLDTSKDTNFTRIEVAELVHQLHSRYPVPQRSAAS